MPLASDRSFKIIPSMPHTQTVAITVAASDGKLHRKARRIHLDSGVLGCLILHPAQMCRLWAWG
jgi:hypothetical protein